MLPLTPTMEKFVLHWGEMGTRWGVNRTVAQIHALLYLAPRPLNAEEIATTLSVARSNVSTSLRELMAWGLIRTASVLGDRREHYETFVDVWEMFLTVMDERKRREIDPTIAVLRECVEMAAKDRRTDAHVQERLDEQKETLREAKKLEKEKDFEGALSRVREVTMSNLRVGSFWEDAVQDGKRLERKAME